MIAMENEIIKMPGERLVVETQHATIVITSSGRGFDEVAISPELGRGLEWIAECFKARIEPVPNTQESE